MSDALMQYVMPLIIAICCALTIKRSGRVLNPVVIVSVTFFLPMILATLRLSSLQASVWLPETYTCMWLIVGSWLLIPTIWIVARGHGVGQAVDVGNKGEIGKELKFALRVVAVIAFSAYALSNYLQAGTFLPILHPEVAYKLHTEFYPGLRLFARCVPVCVGTSYLLYVVERRPIDLVLLLISFLVPLSRLSRIDVALSLVILLILFSYRPAFVMTATRKIVAVVCLAMLVIGGAELGNQRTNRFGTYEVKYENAIGWRADISGPAGVLPIAYGYFPLSFENFDSAVRQIGDQRTNGTLSFDWFFTGFVKLNAFSSEFLAMQAEARFVPIASAANVPTALLPFYSDFGVLGMIFPASLYMCFWVFIFHRVESHGLWVVGYGLYSGAFALSSFQGLIVAPIIFHQLLLLVLVAAWARYRRIGLRGNRND